MSLNSAWLDAFLELTRERSFSRAARKLFITQSALSQRISKLEDELATSLIVRDPAGLRLTAAGEALLRHCRERDQLEGDFLRAFVAADDSVRGAVRIGAYSTVQRSYVLPALDKLVRAGGVSVEIQSGELRDLPGLLRSSRVDYVLLNEIWQHAGVQSELLGHEENVLVESTKISAGRREVYLDHDAEDPTTLRYLKKAGMETSRFERLYLDEIYAILDGVRLGWGRAVVPRHLVEGDRQIRVCGKLKMRDPIYLHFYEQNYYPRLHGKVLEALRAGFPDSKK